MSLRSSANARPGKGGLGCIQGTRVAPWRATPILPPWDDSCGNEVGKVADFSQHAGVAAKAHERKKLERLCRYISRPAASQKRLSLTPNGNIRYDVKGFTSVAGARMRRNDPAQDALP